MQNDQPVTLQTLSRGAALEMFQMELEKVLANIEDPNTKAVFTRKITLAVAIKPDDDREIAQIKVDCKSTMAPMHPHETRVYLGKQDGQFVAVEHDPKQLRMFDSSPAEENDKVRSIKDAKAGKE